MSFDALTSQVQALLNGLWFPSETEAPWTLPTWSLKAIDVSDIRLVLRRDAHAAVTSISLEDLMRQIERRFRGYGEEGKNLIERHRSLITLLQENCDRVQVFRVGEVTVDILVVGEVASDQIILQTQSIET